jgi:hypothetical protein
MTAFTDSITMVVLMWNRYNCNLKFREKKINCHGMC